MKNIDSAPFVKLPSNETKEDFSSLVNEAIDFIAFDQLPDTSSVIRNPFRFTQFAYDGTIKKKGYELLNQLNGCVQNTFGMDHTQEAKIKDIRSQLISYLSQLEDITNMIITESDKIREDIIKCTFKIDAERGVSQEETVKNINLINEQTGWVSETDSWSSQKVQEMSTEELTEHINRVGSGRYFLHSFPKVSLKNGVICTGIGGHHQLGGFETIRDGPGGIDIDFSCEHDMENAGFYGTISEFEGNIFFSAEVILENYAFINLPYSLAYKGKERDWTSSEWRLYGPPTNPMSRLHIVPLRLGICFFSDKYREDVEQIISRLPIEQQPNKIIYHSDYPHVALQDLLKRLPSKKGLPRLSEPIQRIGKIGNDIPVFGTKKVAEDWG